MLTNFGFTWGGLVEVERTASFDRKGGTWRVLTVKTPKESVEIYVTPTGFLRFMDVRKKAKKDKKKS